jgi:phosphoglycolate phosphatase-like HAD superfamily hydrolase
MNQRRPLVALDFDGTLVSCREKQLYALREALKAHSIHYKSFDEFWALKRGGETTVAALLATGVGEALANQAAKSWIEIVESEMACRHDRLLPDVFEALRALSVSADLMLLSARRDAALLQRQLISMDLLRFLQKWETVSPLVRPGEAKAHRLIHHGACCYVGDTEGDWRASKTAQIPVFLLSTGQRSRSFLKRQLAQSRPLSVFSGFKYVANSIRYGIANKQLR